MRAVVQRVLRASVRVEGETVGEIGHGLLVLLGVGKDDGPADVAYMVDKLPALRIFNDAEEKMNLSLREVGGAALVVSQFTLHGDARNGRRPGYGAAAPPELANRLYEEVVAGLRAAGVATETGRFRAMMRVELVNDGPVTILLDSKKTF